MRQWRTGGTRWAQWLMLLALFLPVAALAAAGRFQFVAGAVHIVAPDGKTRLALKGSPVASGDAIITADNASAQLRMRDGGILAIRPATRMKIDAYHFDGKQDGSEKSFFSLLKGGFRSITGLIGKLHKSAYRIRTPAATIGIRGTDSETVHVPPPPTGGPAPAVPPGTYNKVNVGATIVNGTVVGPNQVAYTPNLGTPAVILPKMPSIFEPAKPARRAQEEESQQTETNATQESGEEAAAAGEDQEASASFDNAPLLSPPAPSNPIVQNVSDATGGVALTALGSSTHAAPVGSAGVGADIRRNDDANDPLCSGAGFCGGGGSIVLDGTAGKSILLDENKVPVLIAENTASEDFSYSAGTAAWLDAGKADIHMPGSPAVKLATVQWGRYVGNDAIVDKMGVRDPIGSMHLMLADQALSYHQALETVMGAGKLFDTSPVTFNYIAGSGTVSDELNQIYAIQGTSYFQYTGSQFELKIDTNTVGGRTWLVSWHGDLAQVYHEGAGNHGMTILSGSCSGCPASPVTSGQASGALVGSNAEGAITSFSANTSSSSLAGTAAFQR